MTVPLATKIMRFKNILLKISPESEGVREGDINDTVLLCILRTVTGQPGDTLRQV